jgi:hypothetical protein
MPKCGQESMVRVATGQENRKFMEVYRVRLLLESVIEFLPGQLMAGPFMHPKPKSYGAE